MIIFDFSGCYCIIPSSMLAMVWVNDFNPQHSHVKSKRLNLLLPHYRIRGASLFSWWWTEPWRAPWSIRGQTKMVNGMNMAFQRNRCTQQIWIWKLEYYILYNKTIRAHEKLMRTSSETKLRSCLKIVNKSNKLKLSRSSVDDSTFFRLIQKPLATSRMVD